MEELLRFQILKCLLITIILELIISLILGVRKKKDFLNIILVNGITNPLVSIFIYFCNVMYFDPNIWVIVLIIMEILAVLFEGFIYKKYLKYNAINPYVLSVILNISSYFLGTIIDTQILYRRW